jgi:hypothetical protein
LKGFQRLHTPIGSTIAAGVSLIVMMWNPGNLFFLSHQLFDDRH